MAFFVQKEKTLAATTATITSAMRLLQWIAKLEWMRNGGISQVTAGVLDHLYEVVFVVVFVHNASATAGKNDCFGTLDFCRAWLAWNATHVLIFVRSFVRSFFFRGRGFSNWFFLDIFFWATFSKGSFVSNILLLMHFFGNVISIGLQDHVLAGFFFVVDQLGVFVSFFFLYSFFSTSQLMQFNVLLLSRSSLRCWFRLDGSRCCCFWFWFWNTSHALSFNACAILLWLIFINDNFRFFCL